MIKQHCSDSGRDVIGRVGQWLNLCGWFKYLKEDGMKDLRARWVFTVGILYLLSRGKGCNSHVRSGWGQIRCSLPFAMFLTCINALDWNWHSFMQKPVHPSFGRVKHEYGRAEIWVDR